MTLTVPMTPAARARVPLRRSRLVLIAALVGLATTACPADAPATRDAMDGGSDPTDVTPDTPGPDGAAPDGIFELGVNVTGKNTPEFYAPLEEGGELVVEYGPQGLWMVVLAFRTQNMLTAPVDLDGSIHVDGDELGRLQIVDKVLFPGGDSWDYFYNFFLVVEDPTLVDMPATIRFTVTDDAGGVADVTRGVLLTGGISDD